MKVICFGDSNTFGYDPHARCGEPYAHPWPELLGQKTGWQVVNEGVNGREVPETPASVPEDADLYLVMLGTNDLLQLDTPEAAAARMEVFLSGGDPSKMTVIAPPPMVPGLWVQDEELIADSLQLSACYDALCRRLGVRFVDAGQWNVPLSVDGVHFTEEGHRVFAEGLFRALIGEDGK